MTTCKTIADRCGACCYTGRIPIMRDDSREGIAQWMLDIRKPVGEPCPALDVDERRCTIYERRPKACRRFTPGSTQCWASRETLLTIGGGDE